MNEPKLAVFFNTASPKNSGSVLVVGLWLTSKNLFFHLLFDGETPNEKLSYFMDTWGFSYGDRVEVESDNIDELEDMIKDLQDLKHVQRKGSFFSALPIWSNDGH